MPRDGQPDRRRAQAAAWALLLAALLAFLAFGVEPERTIFWNAFFDAGHVPLFGLAAVAIRGLLRARTAGGTEPLTSWLAFALTIALGALTEALQFFQPSRDPSLEDLLRDVAGASAFLLLAAAWRSRAAGSGLGEMPGRAGRWLPVLLAIALIGAAGARLAMTSAACVERGRALPTLFALDGSWWEPWFIEPHDGVLTPGARPHGLEGKFEEPLARLDLKPGTYPGLTFEEPYPDWSGYRRLVFTVVSDLDTPLSLTIRVHDVVHDQRYEDRFNRSLTVVPGVDHFSIPLDDIRYAPDRREMDMRRIRGVILFTYQLKQPTHIYLGAFRLQ